jgi:hypothetical protein
LGIEEGLREWSGGVGERMEGCRKGSGGGGLLGHEEMEEKVKRVV